MESFLVSMQTSGFKSPSPVTSCTRLGGFVPTTRWNGVRRFGSDLVTSCRADTSMSRNDRPRIRAVVLGRTTRLRKKQNQVTTSASSCWNESRQRSENFLPEASGSSWLRLSAAQLLVMQRPKFHQKTERPEMETVDHRLRFRTQVANNYPIGESVCKPRLTAITSCSIELCDGTRRSVAGGDTAAVAVNHAPSADSCSTKFKTLNCSERTSPWRARLDSACVSPTNTCHS